LHSTAAAAGEAPLPIPIINTQPDVVALPLPVPNSGQAWPMLSVQTSTGQSLGPSPIEKPGQAPVLPLTPAPVSPALEAPTAREIAENSHEVVEENPKPVPLRTPELFGDQAPISALLTLPNGQITGKGLLYVPQVRYFKIGDNDSPRPQDRTYFSFNYFYNLNGTINDLAGSGIQHTRIHREIWGWEWSNADNSASFGMRLPLTTYNAANTVPGLDGTSTDIGDLSLIFKQVFWDDECTGSLLSGGLAITPTTGPGSYAGSNNLKVFHTTTLQPFVGWIFAQDKFYLQGFTAVDCPTDLSDVVMLSNDIAVGYFLYQKPRGSGLTAVVPTVELHVNTPLNHRGVLPLTDPAGTADMINLTAGFHFECNDKSSMGVAFAVPLTGPRPFDFEILAQFRVRY
jgi:hypothetical protein